MSGIDGNWSQFELFFKMDIKKFHDKKLEIVKSVAISGLSSIQIESPVDTGRFRSGHDLTIDEPSQRNPSKGLGKGEYEAIAAQAIEDADMELSRLPKGFLEKIVIFITNNVEYGQFIEDGSYSKDPNAPQKIYERMSEKIKAKIDEEIAKFKL